MSPLPLLLSLVFALLVAWPVAAAELYSTAYGKSSDPAVIFLHGGPGYNSLVFEATTAEALARQGFYVIVYDRRGEGRSRELQDNLYTFAEAIDDIEALYGKYHLTRASLLGHSFGGSLALKFALAHPAQVRQLVWIGSPLAYPRLLTTIQAHCRERYLQQGNQMQLGYLDRLAALPPDSLDYSTYSFMHGLSCGLYQPAHPTATANQLYQRLGSHPQFAAANAPAQAPVAGFFSQEHYTTLDLSQDLKQLKQQLPVYGIYGDEDGLFDPAHLQAIKEILGPERLMLVKGASHNVFVDQQQAFIGQLVKWLKAPHAFGIERDPVVSMTYKDAPVASVLRELAQKADLDLLFLADGTAPCIGNGEDPLLQLQQEAQDSDTRMDHVSCMTSVELNQVAVSQALVQVLKRNGLAARRMHNSLVVDTPKHLSQMATEPLLSKSYVLPPEFVNYGQKTIYHSYNQQIIWQLSGAFASLGLSPEPALQLNPLTSTLKVTGTREALAVADKLISEFKRLPKVKVETTLIEIPCATSEQLGIPHYGPEDAGASLSNPESLYPNRPDCTSLGDFEFLSAHSLVPDFDSRLTTLIKKQIAHPLLRSSMTFVHGFKGIVDFSDVILTGKTDSERDSDLAPNNQLAITPFVDTEKGRLTLKLAPSFKQKQKIYTVPNYPQSACVLESTRTWETILRIPEGDTLVIRSSRLDPDSDLIFKTPLLGDLPIVDSHFVSSEKLPEDAEMLILVTPHILKTE
ncbi:MAG: alpha/beta fold hydrolase [Candidatus Sericytochromatia bacterium]